MRCCLVVLANIFPCFSRTRWHCLVLFHSLVLEVSLGECVLTRAHQWHLCIMHEGFMNTCKRPLTQKWSCLFEVLQFFLVAVCCEVSLINQLIEETRMLLMEFSQHFAWRHVATMWFFAFSQASLIICHILEFFYNIWKRSYNHMDTLIFKLSCGV